MKSSNWTPGGGDAICNRVCLQRVLCGACRTPHRHRQYRMSCFARPAGSEADAAQLQDAGAHPQPARALRSLIERLKAAGDAGLSVQQLSLCTPVSSPRRRPASAWSGCCSAARVHRLPWSVAPAGHGAGLPLSQTTRRRQTGRSAAHAAGVNRAPRRPGAANAHASLPALRSAGAELAVAGRGDGHGAGGAGPDSQRAGKPARAGARMAWLNRSMRSVVLAWPRRLSRCPHPSHPGVSRRTTCGRC